MIWTDTKTASTHRRLTLSTLVGGAIALAMMAPAQASPDDADDGDGTVIEQVGPVGFFYGTFGQSPNQFLLVGGTAEEFCEANPADPFAGEPGTTESKTTFMADGSIVDTIDESDQPIYVYEADIEGAPPWIGQVCAEYFATGATPTPLASGEGELDARVRFVSPDHIEIFNGVTGEMTGADGAEYRVEASADFTLINGAPDSSPDQFVSYTLTPKD